MEERPNTPPSSSPYHRPEQDEAGKAPQAPPASQVRGPGLPMRSPRMPVPAAAPSAGPTVLRSIKYPMGGVFVVGALIGCMMWLWISSANSPDKIIRGFAAMNHVPSCREGIPHDSPGVDQWRQGAAAYEQEDWLAAASAFEMASTWDPSLRQARHFQGIALLAAEKPEDAVRAFEADLQYARDNGLYETRGATLYYLAKAYCGMGEGEKAAEVLNECVAQGGEMVEECVKFMNALSNQLMMTPKS